MPYRICKTFSFEAAHFLPAHDGKCRNMHGHSYRVEVVLEGELLEDAGAKQGMLIDFTDLKSFTSPLVDTLDHQSLNHLFGSPTAEVLAKYIFECIRVQLLLRSSNIVWVHRVRVWETTDSWAEYYE